MKKESVRIRRSGLFRYVDLGEISYKNLNFLSVVDKLPKIPSGFSRQVYSSKVRAVKFEAYKENPHRNRMVLENEEIDHAGLDKGEKYVMVSSEGSSPCVWLWNPKNWSKYCRHVKENPYFSA